jgi:hypothetical protein
VRIAALLQTLVQITLWARDCASERGLHLVEPERGLSHSWSISVPIVEKSMSPPQDVTVIERAFELARSGEFESLDKIKARLSREGYEREQIFGRQLSRQLNEAMRQAKRPKTDQPGPKSREPMK